MIKQIKSIGNFGIYNDFKWDSHLDDFKEKNIIYGWNYAGKTTLSRIFSSLRDRALHPKYPNAKFKVLIDEQEFSQDNLSDLKCNIEVFNTEFIRDNLQWDNDEELNAIMFDVGPNIEIRAEIEKNLKTIESIYGADIINGRVKKYWIIVDDYNEFDEHRFSDEAKRIKNDILNSIIEFNKVNFKTVRNEIIHDLDGNFIDNSEELQSLHKSALANNDRVEQVTIAYEIKIQDLWREVLEILQAEPSKTEIISILDNSSDLYGWSKVGYELHKEKLDECAFCGNKIEIDRIELLTNYFSNEAAELRDRIIKVHQDIQDEMVAITQINIPLSRNDIVSAYQNNYSIMMDSFQAIKDNYIVLLDKLVSKLNIKEARIFEKIDFEEFDKLEIVELNKWLAQMSQLIIDHNDYVKDFDNKKNQAIDKVKKHYVARFLIENEYLNKKHESEFSEKCIDRYNSIVQKIKEKNKQLEAKLKSVAAGGQELNKYIKAFLHRDDIGIEVTDSEKFILKRGSHYAENLSEGEKMAISFAYFLTKLESLHREKKLVNTIVYIDDPISSLDANHIAHVYSLINSFFFRKGLNENNPEQAVLCFKQLFISTHNFEFFSFLKDSKQINKKKSNNTIKTCSYYFLRRISNTTTNIINLPKALERKSEYVFLFEILYNFYLSGCNVEDEKYILIPNALRRFFEIYTFTKIPDSTGEVDSRLNILMGEGHSLKVLHHFSHFTTFEKLTKHDELIFNLPIAMEELMTLLQKDVIHFESLKRAIKVN